MKVLILNGSPRRHGNMSKMLELMKQELEGCGVGTVYIDVPQLQVHPCIGCMKCRSSLKCCLPYWGNMPGEVKVLFDRMVYGMMGENSWGMPLPLHKGKKAIVVSTCTTPYPFNILYNQTHGVVKAFREILKWSGFKIVKTIERGGTKKHPELTEKDMRNCKKAVHKLL